MSTTPVYGYAGQLGIDTVSPVTVRFSFRSSTLGVEEEFVDTNGLRGTRDRDISRIVAGTRRADGGLRLQPDAVELALLLPWIMGGAPSGVGTVTYPLADTLSSRYVVVDKVAKVCTYDSVYVDRFTISGSQGEPLDMELDCAGIDETVGNAGTFPALSIDSANTPFLFQQLSLSVGGVTYFSRDFRCVVDNALDKDRFFNSQTRTAITPTDRHVSVHCTLPAKDAWAAYGAGAGGLAVTATFTNGGAVLTLSLVKVAFPRKPVSVDPGEIFIPMEGIAYHSGSTASLVATLNVGP